MKQPARLGEHVTSGLSHQLAWASSYSPILAIKGRGRLKERVQHPGKHISLKISEKKEKEEENQGRGSSVTLP